MNCPFCHKKAKKEPENTLQFFCSCAPDLIHISANSKYGKRVWCYPWLHLNVYEAIWFMNPRVFRLFPFLDGDMIVEIQSGAENITPYNLREKLPTLLIFS